MDELMNSKKGNTVTSIKWGILVFLILFSASKVEIGDKSKNKQSKTAGSVLVTYVPAIFDFATDFIKKQLPNRAG